MQRANSVQQERSEYASVKPIAIHIGTSHIPQENPDDTANKIYILTINASLFFFSFSIWISVSRTFTIHRIAGEGEGYPYNCSLPFPPDS